MHRSGTSVLTRVLQLLGAELGDNLLPPEAGVNERGFWEHQQVVALNQRLLEILDHPWYDFRPLPDNWMKHPGVGARLPEATEILENTLESGELAAIKDPRLCLLLPFWEQAAQRAGWSPRVVLANRNPSEVMASLCRRDPLDPDTALLLWLRYSHEAELSSRPLPRTGVDYGELLRDWRGTAARIEEALGLEWPISPEEASEQIDAAIDPGLRHQSGGEHPDDNPLLDLATRLHRLITNDPTNLPALDACWAEFDTLLQRCNLKDEALAASIRHLFLLNSRHHQLGQEHALALETLQQRDQQMQARTLEWEQLGKELEYCRSIVEERDRQLQETNRRFHDLETRYRGLVEQHRKLEQDHRDLEKSWQALDERYRELIDHPVIRLARKLFLRRSE